VVSVGGIADVGNPEKHRNFSGHILSMTGLLSMGNLLEFYATR
jgi:hypothetical protein